MPSIVSVQFRQLIVSEHRSQQTWPEFTKGTLFKPSVYLFPFSNVSVKIDFTGTRAPQAEKKSFSWKPDPDFLLVICWCVFVILESFTSHSRFWRRMLHASCDSQHQITSQTGNDVTNQYNVCGFLIGFNARQFSIFKCLKLIDDFSSMLGGEERNSVVRWWAKTDMTSAFDFSTPILFRLSVKTFCLAVTVETLFKATKLSGKLASGS